MKIFSIELVNWRAYSEARFELAQLKNQILLLLVLLMDMVKRAFLRLSLYAFMAKLGFLL